MGVKWRIATEVLDAIVADARAAGAAETCGLLFGEDGIVTAGMASRNVADDPRRRFEIDPAALIAAHRRERAGGPRILGCYHSHPDGSPDPSPRDAADAAPNGWLWLIVGADRAALWRAVPDGSAHGRFDPVPFACVGGVGPSQGGQT